MFGIEGLHLSHCPCLLTRVCMAGGDGGRVRVGVVGWGTIKPTEHSDDAEVPEQSGSNCSSHIFRTVHRVNLCMGGSSVCQNK